MTETKQPGCKAAGLTINFFLRYRSTCSQNYRIPAETSQNMAWITRLSEGDYLVAKRLGTSVVFSDTRNRRSYQINADGVQHIIKRIGLYQPDKLWVSMAIQFGYIPHPYDEYV